MQGSINSARWRIFAMWLVVAACACGSNPEPEADAPSNSASAGTPSTPAAAGTPGNTAAAGTPSHSALAGSPSTTTDAGSPAAAPNDGGAGAAGEPAGSDADSVPCEVSKALAASCHRCHGSVPANGAPMSLVTLADFQSLTISGRPRVPKYEAALARMNGTKRPQMPPVNSPITDEDKQLLIDWLSDGAPAGDAGGCL
jgi:hypothetical protein